MIRLQGGFSLNSVQVQLRQTYSDPFQMTFEVHLGHSSGFPIPEGHRDLYFRKFGEEPGW
jgi:hypothetical protein